MEQVDSHLNFMGKAIEEANKAYDRDEVPIGAVIVLNNKILGKGFNQTQQLQDATAHAEMLAITAAANELGSKYLEECTLYVTVEPCVMCMGAIKNSRIGNLIIGALEPKTGYSNFVDETFYGSINISNGIRGDECKRLMQTFFKGKRKK